MLALIAIFKNEADGMDEWMRHYIALGVSHFYMIDNGSTDNWQPILQKYKEKVTLFSFSEPHQQMKHYSAVLPLVKEEWCLCVDLDEFMFPTDESMNLLDYCKKYMPSDGPVSQVHVSWRIFGSDGYIQQPTSVRTSFTHCMRELTSAKSMFRVDRIKDKHDMKIHSQEVQGTSIRDDENLHLFHYVLQSWEWFQRVKMTRGAPDTYVNLRTKEYFQYYNGKCDCYCKVLKQRVERGLYG